MLRNTHDHSESRRKHVHVVPRVNTYPHILHRLHEDNDRSTNWRKDTRRPSPTFVEQAMAKCSEQKQEDHEYIMTGIFKLCRAQLHAFICPPVLLFRRCETTIANKCNSHQYRVSDHHRRKHFVPQEHDAIDPPNAKGKSTMDRSLYEHIRCKIFFRWTRTYEDCDDKDRDRQKGPYDQQAHQQWPLEEYLLFVFYGFVDLFHLGVGWRSSGVFVKRMFLIRRQR
mmetsp:Transcript_114285/g.178657  ORF Transcript_114285/g.178657 Transcript_114285/m.178657 type:complete len:225 (-) Transcript_114285:125-799(-)